MPTQVISADDIIEFWYSPRIAPCWFASTAEIDSEIRRRFEATWEQAASGRLDHWRDSPEGCLALVIVLDQFPLNTGWRRTMHTTDD